MTKSKKLTIGISLRIMENPDYDESRDALSHDWIQLFEKLKINPLFIPNTIENIESFLDDMEIDGLILSGGDDLGQTPARDNTEQKILDFSCKNKIPLIGICRGMQAINDFFGGSIETLHDSSHVNHNHSISIEKKLSSILETKKFQVNSYHHNIIKKNLLGKNLQPFAIADDSTVEGFFHTKFPLYGVMWHPERNFDMNNELILRKIFYSSEFSLND